MDAKSFKRDLFELDIIFVGHWPNLYFELILSLDSGVEILD